MMFGIVYISITSVDTGAGIVKYYDIKGYFNCKACGRNFADFVRRAARNKPVLLFYPKRDSLTRCPTDCKRLEFECSNVPV